MAYDPTNFIKGASFGGGLSGLLGGLFGGHSDPYKDAMKQYQQYAGQAAGYQNPFFQAGTGAIPQYQNYLQGMSNPSEFLNNLMGQYQKSPGYDYLQDQSIKAAQNAASASGLSGSSALTQAIQQNASNLASQDMNNWLQNALGINQQYGAGLGGLLGMGQGAANQLSNIYGNLGQQMGEGAYGSRMAKNNQMSDIFGGLGNLAMFGFL